MIVTKKIVMRGFFRIWDAFPEEPLFIFRINLINEFFRINYLVYFTFPQ